MKEETNKNTIENNESIKNDSYTNRKNLDLSPDTKESRLSIKPKERDSLNIHNKEISNIKPQNLSHSMNLEESDLKNSLDNTVNIPKDAYRRILMHFDVYSILTDNDLEELKSIFPDSQKVSSFLVRTLQIGEDNIKDLTKLEIFILLTNFCLKNQFSDNEICCLFSILWDVLTINFRKKNKKEVFEVFKGLLIRCSMDRPPFQLGIFKKTNIELISDFFIDNIYSKFELLMYLTTEKKMIELHNQELFSYSLPHTLDLEMGEEVLPRNNKVLKQYYESKKPKSELEQKIDIILDFEREKLDRELNQKFKEQDEAFNKRLEEMISKKKK